MDTPHQSLARLSTSDQRSKSRTGQQFGSSLRLAGLRSAVARGALGHPPSGDGAETEIDRDETAGRQHRLHGVVLGVADAADAVWGALQDLGNAILDFGQDVIDFFEGFFTDLGDLVSDIANEIASWFSNNKTVVTYVPVTPNIPTQQAFPMTEP